MTLSYINNTKATAGQSGFRVSERAFNIYPKLQPFTETLVWQPTPGWSVRQSLGRKQPRGSVVFKGKMYAVLDGNLFEVRLNDTIVSVGALRTATGRCHLAEDGISMVITDGEYMYHFDGESFTTLSIPFPHPTGVVFHEGHFLAIEGGTGKVYYSGKFDGSSWEALDFFTAEDKSDNVLALASSTSLMLLGEYTTQPYLHRQAAAPFYPYQQGRLYYGIIGDTVEVIAGNVVWLGRTKEGRATLIVHNGSSVQRDVVNPWLIQEISRLDTIEDAFSNTITWEGERWYILTFPTERRTFVINQLGSAFEWGDWRALDNKFVEHPMVDAQYFEHTNFFFDDDGELQELSKNVHANGTLPRISGGRSSVYEETGQRIYIPLWEVHSSVGQGGATMQLRWSRDGGMTWTSWIPYDMGDEGEWDKRIRAHRLGAGYQFVLEWRVSDEVDFRMTRNVLQASLMSPYLERRNERVGDETWTG